MQATQWRRFGKIGIGFVLFALAITLGSYGFYLLAGRVFVAVVLCPVALTTGLAMICFPGDAVHDSNHIEMNKDWEALWRQVRWTTKLVWLHGLCLGVVGFLIALMYWLAHSQ